jgi:hypothetical protein
MTAVRAERLDEHDVVLAVGDEASAGQSSAVSGNHMPEMCALLDSGTPEVESVPGVMRVP